MKFLAVLTIKNTFCGRCLPFFFTSQVLNPLPRVQEYLPYESRGTRTVSQYSILNVQILAFTAFFVPIAWACLLDLANLCTQQDFGPGGNEVGMGRWRVSETLAEGQIIKFLGQQWSGPKSHQCLHGHDTAIGATHAILPIGHMCVSASSLQLDCKLLIGWGLIQFLLLHNTLCSACWLASFMTVYMIVKSRYLNLTYPRYAKFYFHI